MTTQFLEQMVWKDVALIVLWNVSLKFTNRSQDLEKRKKHKALKIHDHDTPSPWNEVFKNTRYCLWRYLERCPKKSTNMNSQSPEHMSLKIYDNVSGGPWTNILPESFKNPSLWLWKYLEISWKYVFINPHLWLWGSLKRYLNNPRIWHPKSLKGCL